MAIPSSYTEDALKAFMLTALEDLGSVLGLNSDRFNEAVNETLLAYATGGPLTEIANATNIPKLRALAKVEAWKVAIRAASGRIDWSEAGAFFKQSQYRLAAEAGLALAQLEAVQAGYLPDAAAWTGGEITLGQMSSYDPYA